MLTIKNVLIRWAALPIWTVLLGFSLLPGIAGTLQPPGTPTNQGENRAADPPSQSAGSAKPDGTEAPSLGKPADSSVAPLPAGTPDNRDLIRRRMELCRHRPEVCVQRGKDNDRPQADEPGVPGRDN
jgi:hypothetical protein